MKYFPNYKKKSDMKNYEKKYKEALERAKYLKENTDGVGALDVSACFEQIFPELCESEDERIRKTLIHIVKGACNKYGIKYQEKEIGEEKLLSWLEKQGNYDYKRVNLNNFDDRIRDFSDMLEDKPKPYWDGWYEAMDYVLKNGNPFEKQTKQNYIDADEDWYDFVRWFVKERTDNYTLIPSDDDIHDWGNIILNHARKLLEKQGEQKPADSYCQENCKGFKETGKCFVDGGCKAKRESESIDKDEPKFNVGDWVAYVYNVANVYQVKKIDYTYIIPRYELENIDGDKLSIPFTADYNLRNWTIQEAKDGDVLVNGSNIFIFSNLSDTRAMGYCHINLDDGRFYDDKGKNECFGLIDSVFIPATKEQRDFLFQKMKESGYEFDAEKKESKKIEQNFSLSEEDERMFYGLISIVEDWYNTMSVKEKEYYGDCGYIKWLNSLKNRIQPQPKQEWSEEDEKKRKTLIKGLEDRMGFGWASDPFSREEYIDWLKSLKPQTHWKPSEEQILTLSALCIMHKESKVLESLYNDLKKL